MQVTLIGFGEVGSTVAALINTTYEYIRINVMNTQSTKSGRILDLEHAAAVRNNLIFHNDHLEHENADVVIYSAGFSNAHGESRNSVAHKNKKLVFSLFGDIHYSKQPTIIVITNPVEPISYWIKQVIADQARVIGTGTALDTFRLKYILSKKFACYTSDIDCLVIGEHGQHMVPVYSHAMVKGEKLTSLCDEKELALITNELIQSAFQIRETEKATKYGIAETTLYLMKALTSDELITIAASFNEFGQWEDNYNFPSSLYISLPYEVDKNNSIPKYLDLTAKENQDLQRAIDSIRKQII